MDAHSLSIKHFKNKADQLSGVAQGRRFLAAVSGGADSMVMAWLLKNSGYDFAVAHVNYALRDTDSDLDEQLVEDFCEKHCLQLYVLKAQEKSKPEGSVQLWARQVRYTFFEELMQQHDLDGVFTAHHADDQLETFLVNLSRASGLRGLSGIPENENKILRPLLSFKKEEIYAFAAQHNIPFREDKSNKKDDYLRNRLRNGAIPALVNAAPGFRENFLKSQQYLSQAQQFIDGYLMKNFPQVFGEAVSGVLDLSQLKSEAQVIRQAVFSELGFTGTTEINKILSADSGSRFRSGTHHLTVHRNEILFEPNYKKSKNQDKEYQLQRPLASNSISIPPEIAQKIAIAGSCHWKLDAERADFPLLLRKKQPGDRFSPAGSRLSKTVSKYLKDEKLPILASQNVWVLCGADGKILGILPLRQDAGSVAAAGTANYYIISIP